MNSNISIMCILPSPNVVSSLFVLMIRRPPRSTLSSSSAASDVYKRQVQHRPKCNHRPGLRRWVRKKVGAPAPASELLETRLQLVRVPRAMCQSNTTVTTVPSRTAPRLQSQDHSQVLSLIHISEPTRPY
eukprot:TRINITY_DN13424_c0_g1_i1.p1 TRINITY_DN13424_c0_g1~~TRINITY_DN13424_c0_g1_i1.p1  ORF type:complete len:130 (-),score=10.10 TRINITY_DN13424_c0_g1_i1:70-459(-)